MFKSISEEVYNYLNTITAFTDVMVRNGKVFLFPIVASEGTDYPFSTYILSERLPDTKDRSLITITLMLWFSAESYKECCELTDAICEAIDVDHILTSAQVDYNEQYNTYAGMINFQLTN